MCALKFPGSHVNKWKDYMNFTSALEDYNLMRWLKHFIVNYIWFDPHLHPSHDTWPLYCILIVYLVWWSTVGYRYVSNHGVLEHLSTRLHFLGLGKKCLAKRKFITLTRLYIKKTLIISKVSKKKFFLQGWQESCGFNISNSLDLILKLSDN